MKTKKIIILILLIASAFVSHGQTWDEWFKQKKTQRKYLLQQIAKLQVYLGYVKKGYDITQFGMKLISNIKEGDYSLHWLFFDHLKQVSPWVKKYEKTFEILRLYGKVFQTYKTSFKKYQQSDQLSKGEVDYLYGVFTNILDKLTTDIDQLTVVITDYHLEMSDDERIKRIDFLYQSVMEKYTSLQSFIGKTDVLILQRKREINNLETIKNWYLP